MATSNSLEEVHTLDLVDYDWLRVDLRIPESCDPYDLLTASVEHSRLDATIQMGSRIGDLIGTTWPELFLVSDRFVDVLSSAEMVGWQTQPVEIRTPGKMLPRVRLLQVTGKCGPVSQSGVGRFLDSRTLTGADLFVPMNEATIMLSGRGAEVLKRGTLRNVEIVNAGLESF